MPTAKRARAKKTRKPRTAVAQDVWARTQLLVEVLLEVMEGEIRAVGEERSERWLKLFGPKDSAVVNLQKLVQLLAELQQQSPPPQSEALAPVSTEELALLSDWLRTPSVASVSLAAE